MKIYTAVVVFVVFGMLAYTKGKFALKINILSRSTTKQLKWPVCPVKTQISLAIRPVWSESSLSVWRSTGSLAIHTPHSEGSDQTGWVPRLMSFSWFCRASAKIIDFVSQTISLHDRRGYQLIPTLWWQYIYIFVKVRCSLFLYIC